MQQQTGHTLKAFDEDIEYLRGLITEMGQLAHAAIRERIPFLARDRALDGEVAIAVRLVKEGAVLAAARG